MNLSPELEAFIEVLEVPPLSAAFDWERARQIAQILRRADARPDVWRAFDRAAAETGLPGTIEP
jgi:hypothetical protein